MITTDEKIDTANPDAARARNFQAAARQHDKFAAKYAVKALKFFIASILAFVSALFVGDSMMPLIVALHITTGVTFVFTYLNAFHAFWHSNESYKSSRKAISAYNKAICTALDDLSLARDFERAQNIAG